jgi:hypothetical protein
MKNNNDDNQTVPVEIQFQINEGTTYYYFNNQQLVVEVAPKSGPITAPDISLINNLQTQYKNYTYSDYSSAQKTFASHLGKNGLGDNEKFNITFNAPVKLETVTIWWKMENIGGPNIPNSCIFPDGGFYIATYQYIGEDENANWTNLYCIDYTEDFIKWALPPDPKLLRNYPETANLMFTTDQYNNAKLPFKYNSGIPLGGSNTKFSVEMSRISFI